MRHYSWAAVAGAAVSVGSQLLKPKAKAGAAAPQVDLVAEQKAAIAGNTANEGDIESLLGRANQFNQNQANSLIEQSIPGYGKLTSQLSNQASEDLAHPFDLPTDVSKNIERLAAERGISAGTRGQFNDFSMLRDFGIDSLAYGNSRINQAQGITGLLSSIAPKVNPLSPMSMYVTPQQSAQVAAGNQSTLQASNNARAAADNYNNADEWGSITHALGSVIPAAAESFGNRGNLVDPNSNAGMRAAGAPSAVATRYGT